MGRAALASRPFPFSGGGIMAEKACIFVDGENFRHSIVDVFEGEFTASNYLPKAADWTRFFDYLVQEVVNQYFDEIQRLRTYWYVVQHVDFRPYNLPNPNQDPESFFTIVRRDKNVRTEIETTGDAERAERLIQIYRRLQAREKWFFRRFQGWTTVQNGIAGKHTSVEFRRAGAITYNLYQEKLGQEKSVDVKLAVDMIVLKDIYDYAIIVSGDQDYVPAVQAVKDFGKRVVNVSFLTRSGNLLPGGARRLNQITDSCVQVPYDRLRALLKIDE
jgi:uncharacterized LabA/DUF88 family protein